MATVLDEMLDIGPIELRAPIEEALCLILSELHYSRNWDEIRPETSLQDKDKPVECWLTWMQHYLTKAISECTHSVTKEEALESIRKIAGLATTCMIHNETRPRAPKARPTTH